MFILKRFIGDYKCEVTLHLTIDQNNVVLGYKINSKYYKINNKYFKVLKILK